MPRQGVRKEEAPKAEGSPLCDLVEKGLTCGLQLLARDLKHKRQRYPDPSWFNASKNVADRINEVSEVTSLLANAIGRRS